MLTSIERQNNPKKNLKAQIFWQICNLRVCYAVFSGMA